MQRLAAIRSFCRAWFLRRRMEREMDEEMRFHLEARIADLVARGLTCEDAEYQARSEFGGVLRAKDEGRDARGLRWVDDLGGDLRYALRAIRRAPVFTAAAVASIALGIGANTAIFGVLDLLLLRPVPVSAPHELVHVTTAGDRGDANSGSSNAPWFRKVASRTDLFSDAMLVKHDVHKIGIDGRVEPLTSQQVTTNYYQLLGVPALLGRTFVPSDRPETGGSPVAVISYDLWQRRFAGATNVIGASLTVDRQPYTIIGVAPREFSGLVVGWTMDVTTPLDTSKYDDARGWSTMPLIARVKPGVTPAQISAQLTPVLLRMSEGVTERFRNRYLKRVSVESAAQGLTDLRAAFSRPLRLLMGAVGILLLIACVNLAGLLVARNTARQHEFGLRAALGARPERIMRQLFAESALLAVLGAVPGVILGMAGGNRLLAVLPKFFGPVGVTVTADSRVLAFALVATVATTLLFGVIPAFQAARVNVSREVVRTNVPATATRVRIGRALVIAQCALSVVLVAGATLFLRTLLNLSNVDPGFDVGHVIAVTIDPAGTDYEGERLRGFQREMIDALSALPGVNHASVTTSSPFSGNIDGRRLSVPGFEPRDLDDATIQTNLVGPGYFDTLRLPILRGRAIDARDRPGTPAVAVVSESFANRYFGGLDAAIGRQFAIGRAQSAVTHEIVGVAREARYQTLREPSDRIVYVPVFQALNVRPESFEFVIQTAGDPSRAIALTRSALERLRPDAPILAIQTMTGVINGRLLSERLLAILGTFFAAVALMLAGVGVYGLLAYLVARRLPEFGVRVALGARPIEMMGLTLRENVMLAMIGCALGVGAAFAGLRVLDGLLFGLSPMDLVNLATAAGILTVVSLAAAIVPARRAASVDPLVALRQE